VGSWGSGIFDSDQACDFLGNLVHELADKIDEDLKSAQKPRDYYLHRDAAPAIAILNALVSKIPSARFCLDKKRVRQWRKDYFAWYDEKYVPANGPDEEYRGNIERQLRNLLRNLEIEDREAE